MSILHTTWSCRGRAAVGDCAARRPAVTRALARLLPVLAFAAWVDPALAASRASYDGAPPPGAATLAQEHQPAADHAAAPEAHGLSQKAIEIARPFGFPITNSMVVTWIAAIGLIVLARAATRKMNEVPSGAQNLMEWLVEGLYGLLESILGRHLVERTFWFFGTIFIFILAANWIGLVPGVGTIGWGRQTAHGFAIDQPLFRGANADLNMTLAMALVFFACWIVWAVREVGVGGIAHELFAPKGETAGFMRVLMVIVFFAAGCLEIVSILFRPVSLSFRLYGNVFAGENMLEAMATIVPGLSWLLPIPFYFMELLVGLVQAMVFMLLTAVFTLLIRQHPEEARRRPHTDEAGVGSRTGAQSWWLGESRKDKRMTGSLHVGLAALGAAIGVGLIGQGASIAVGRNPGASTKVMVQSILAIAFAEAIVFYALFLVQ